MSVLELECFGGPLDGQRWAVNPQVTSDGNGFPVVMLETMDRITRADEKITVRTEYYRLALRDGRYVLEWAG